MNLIGGDISHGGETPRFTGDKFSAALPQRFAKLPPGRVTFGIRPEHVGVRGGGTGDIVLPVRLVEPLGKDTLLYFDGGSERAFVAVTEGLAMAELKPGTPIGLSLAPDKIVLFATDGRRID